MWVPDVASREQGNVSISVCNIEAEDPVPWEMVGHRVSSREHRVKERRHPVRMLAWFIKTASIT